MKIDENGHNSMVVHPSNPSNSEESSLPATHQTKGTKGRCSHGIKLDLVLTFFQGLVLVAIAGPENQDSARLQLMDQNVGSQGRLSVNGLAVAILLLVHVSTIAGESIF